MRCWISAKTNGTGLWSRRLATVRIIALQLFDAAGSTLDVYFDPRDWNVDSDGLIYTDEGWLEELNRALVAMGGTDVGYSEMGLQGVNCVNLDVDEQFMQSELGKRLSAEKGGLESRRVDPWRPPRGAAGERVWYRARRIARRAAHSDRAGDR